jgi:hypothetical protein
VSTVLVALVFAVIFGLVFAVLIAVKIENMKARAAQPALKQIEEASRRIRAVAGPPMPRVVRGRSGFSLRSS